MYDSVRSSSRDCEKEFLELWMITRRILKTVSTYLSDCAAANGFTFYSTGKFFELLISLSTYYSEE